MTELVAGWEIATRYAAFPLRYLTDLSIELRCGQRAQVATTHTPLREPAKWLIDAEGAPQRICVSVRDFAEAYDSDYALRPILRAVAARCLHEYQQWETHCRAADRFKPLLYVANARLLDAISQAEPSQFRLAGDTIGVTYGDAWNLTYHARGADYHALLDYSDETLIHLAAQRALETRPMPDVARIYFALRLATEAILRRREDKPSREETR